MSEPPERVTVLAKDFTPAAMEYHRRAMGEKGYSLAGPIVQSSFSMIAGPGEPEPLFEGEVYYAAVFTRQRGSGGG